MVRKSTLVVLVGLVMLFLPEPVSSVLAVGVILVGVAMRLLGGSG